MGPWPRRALWLLAALAVIGILALAAVGGAYYSIYSSATIPAPEDLEHPDPTVITDADGEHVQTLEPAEVRENVSIDDLPEHVPQAVLAAEDRRFHDHGGFSVRGMARAAWANLTAGETLQGASTINQQYVAMAIADIDDTYPGKFREAAIASRLDDELDKDTILERYLNEVPFGRTAIGIQAAARTYFDVDAQDLDVEQAATLAGIIAAPTAFDPERNPEGASNRRDFVLDGMRQMGTLDAGEADEMIGSDLPAIRDEPLFTYGDEAFFVETVRNQVAGLVDDDVDPTLGLEIRTTLDPRAQSLAVAELNEQLEEYPYQGAAVTIESDTGAVRALIGGLDFAESQYNVAFAGDRQPGSAFKTFVLAELVNQGYDPDETRVDAPEELVLEDDEGEETTIGNYSGRGHGEVSVREATVDSINTAYVQMIEDLGAERVAQLATEMGIETELHTYPTLALGTAEVRPLELTVAYSTLAAEGTRHQPHVIERVETHDGEVLHEHEPSSRRVLAPEAANVITDVLVDVVERGTGTAANLARPNAGKTGTTNEYRDAWFVGYTRRHTTGVWVGNLDNTPMEDRISGGSLPAQIWGGYMGALLEDQDPEPFPTPDASGLDPMDGLEEPEPDPEPADPPATEPDDEAREEDEDDEGEDEDEDDDEPDEDDPEEDDPDDGGPDDGEPDGDAPSDPEDDEPEEPENGEEADGGGDDGGDAGDEGDGDAGDEGDGDAGHGDGSGEGDEGQEGQGGGSDSDDGSGGSDSDDGSGGSDSDDDSDGSDSDDDVGADGNGGGNGDDGDDDT